MIWIAHVVYLIIFAALLLANRLKVETREEFSVLPSFEKEKIFKRPWTFVVLTICFLIIDCIVRTIKGGAFMKIFAADIIPTLLFIWMLLLQTKKGCKIEKLRWLPFAVFFVFTLIRNIIGHTVIGIILREIRSLVMLGAFAFVCRIVLENPLELPTAEEKAKDDADYKQRQEERKQREYEKQWREEQARIQAEKDARTHEAYERIVLGKKTSSSSSSSSSYSSSESYGNSYVDKRERTVAEGYDSCANCRYYDGNYCTCRESLSYNNFILTPQASKCGYHR